MIALRDSRKGPINVSILTSAVEDHFNVYVVKVQQTVRILKVLTSVAAKLGSAIREVAVKLGCSRCKALELRTRTTYAKTLMSVLRRRTTALTGIVQPCLLLFARIQLEAISVNAKLVTRKCLLQWGLTAPI